MEPLPIEFHPLAVEEAARARAWYADISHALGESFAAELDAAMERMASAPRIWPVHLHGTRCVPLHRFPYLVVFRVHSESVRIVAVQHGRRRPGNWGQRLADA